jgi:hypothetical protein
MVDSTDWGAKRT